MMSFQVIGLLFTIGVVFVSSHQDVEVRNLELAFDVIDKDDDGVIALNELNPLVHVLKPEMSDEQIKELLKVDDVDKNGTINKKEFTDMMKKKISASKGILTLFKDHALGKDDEISGEDLLTILFQVESYTPKEKALALHGLLDANGDEEIPHDEVVAKLGQSLADKIKKASNDKDGKFTNEELETALKDADLLKEITTHLSQKK